MAVNPSFKNTKYKNYCRIHDGLFYVYISKQMKIYLLAKQL